jgi:hypothetical protein
MLVLGVYSALVIFVLMVTMMLSKDETENVKVFAIVMFAPVLYYIVMALQYIVIAL